MGCNEAKTGARLAELLALEYSVPPDEARQIRTAAALRDIGVQKIPADILCKDGKLTAREFGIMKNHTCVGAEMLADIQGELGVKTRLICQHHHDWHDGGGYWGKRLCELPPYVEIAAIAGFYTSLISARPYRRAFTPYEARRYIYNGAGTRFGHGLTEIFLQLVADGRVTALFEGGDDYTDLENKSVALTIKAGKISAQVLAKAMRAAYRQMQKARDAPGKMSFKQLSKGGSLSEVEITNDNIKAFDPVARKYA